MTMIDRLHTKCDCCEGVLKEISIYDDLDGKVTCTACLKRYDRYIDTEEQNAGLA